MCTRYPQPDPRSWLTACRVGCCLPWIHCGREKESGAQRSRGRLDPTLVQLRFVLHFCIVIPGRKVLLDQRCCRCRSEGPQTSVRLSARTRNYVIHRYLRYCRIGCLVGEGSREILSVLRVNASRGRSWRPSVVSGGLTNRLSSVKSTATPASTLPTVNETSIVVCDGNVY